MTKRFYARARPSREGLGVMLDARKLMTPGRTVFRAPTNALAAAVAAEWQAQGKQIIPASMPLTQIAFAALDGGPAARGQRVSYVAHFAQSDLCCHRAAAPVELVARQGALWDPLVAWGARELGVELPVVTSVLAADVPACDLEAVRAQAEQLDAFHLTALAQAVALTGSVLIGFALVRGWLTAEAAFEAAALDEAWSVERWGEDPEARARLDRLREDIKALCRFVQALSEPATSANSG